MIPLYQLDEKLEEKDPVSTSQINSKEIISEKEEKEDGNPCNQIKPKKTKKPSSFNFKKDYRQRAKKFTCQFCEKKFPKAQALGGHISKAHPN